MARVRAIEYVCIPELSTIVEQWCIQNKKNNRSVDELHVINADYVK